jgi:hypothetical protein
VAAASAPLPGLPRADIQPPVVRPGEILLGATADVVLGGTRRKFPYFGAIRWSSWTANVATGSGDEWVNQCVPNCAEGSYRRYPATISAYAPRGIYFSRMTIVSPTLGPPEHVRIVEVASEPGDLAFRVSGSP